MPGLLQFYYISYIAFPATFKNLSIVDEATRNTTIKYIVMECKNDPEGGNPFWEPNYSHDISPFPECVKFRKYIVYYVYLHYPVSWYVSGSDFECLTFQCITFQFITFTFNVR